MLYLTYQKNYSLCQMLFFIIFNVDRIIMRWDYQSKTFQIQSHLTSYLKILWIENIVNCKCLQCCTLYEEQRKLWKAFLVSFLSFLVWSIVINSYFLAAYQKKKKSLVIMGKKSWKCCLENQLFFFLEPKWCLGNNYFWNNFLGDHVWMGFFFSQSIIKKQVG